MPRQKATDIQRNIDAAAKITDEQPNVQDTITLSNGTVLRCKAVPLLTVRHAAISIEKPEPPTVFHEDKGRSEIWEGDPAYQEALANWEERIGDVTFNVMIMLGTAIESIPEGLESPEDETWPEILEATGLTLNLSTKSARYLSWLRFYAITSNEDYVLISEAVARKSGLLQKDVQSALESFRSGKDGGADLEATSEEQRADGDNISSTNGRVDLGSGGS